jgi:hypothetical protein
VSLFEVEAQVEKECLPRFSTDHHPGKLGVIRACSSFDLKRRKQNHIHEKASFERTADAFPGGEANGAKTSCAPQWSA